MFQTLLSAKYTIRCKVHERALVMYKPKSTNPLEPFPYSKHRPVCPHSMCCSHLPWQDNCYSWKEHTPTPSSCTATCKVASAVPPTPSVTQRAQTCALQRAQTKCKEVAGLGIDSVDLDPFQNCIAKIIAGRGVCGGEDPDSCLFPLDESKSNQTPSSYQINSWRTHMKTVCGQWSQWCYPAICISLERMINILSTINSSPPRPPERSLHTHKKTGSPEKAYQTGFDLFWECFLFLHPIHSDFCNLLDSKCLTSAS